MKPKFPWNKIDTNNMGDVRSQIVILTKKTKIDKLMFN